MIFSGILDIKRCASHIPFLGNAIYQDKGENKEGELRSLQQEINMREEGIFVVVANRHPKVATEPREEIVLTRTGQKILQVDQIDKTLRYFNILREVSPTWNRVWNCINCVRAWNCIRLST